MQRNLRNTNQHDALVDEGESGLIDAIITPRAWLPIDNSAAWGMAWFDWVRGNGGEEPPANIKRSLALYDQLRSVFARRGEEDLQDHPRSGGRELPEHRHLGSVGRLRRARGSASQRAGARCMAAGRSPIPVRPIPSSTSSSSRTRLGSPSLAARRSGRVHVRRIQAGLLGAVRGSGSVGWFGCTPILFAGSASWSSCSS